ncbi:MAG TPA: response regulator [Anaerolineae bacterium]|nr:response regulator [Anaerolineae bacterium]
MTTPTEQSLEGDPLILIIAKPGRIRNGLQALLQIIPRLKVVGIASHSFMAMQMLAQYKPTLALLDVDLPDNQAWVLLKEIQLKQPQTRCLLFVNSIEQQRAARIAGANAALLKGFEALELFTTIEKLLPPYGQSQGENLI